MSEALDVINKIAEKGDKNDSMAASKAFSDIIAVSRYKFDVLSEKRKESY
jgi:hypothetical protein